MAGALHSWQCGICHHVFHAPGRCPRCAARKAGTGEQPSITDRDPGDESRGIPMGIAGPAPELTLDAARIAGLEAEIAGLEAENAKLRAVLAKWSRSQTVPEGSFW